MKHQKTTGLDFFFKKKSLLQPCTPNYLTFQHAPLASSALLVCSQCQTESLIQRISSLMIQVKVHGQGNMMY